MMRERAYDDIFEQLGAGMMRAIVYRFHHVGLLRLVVLQGGHRLAVRQGKTSEQDLRRDVRSIHGLARGILACQAEELAREDNQSDGEPVVSAEQPGKRRRQADSETQHTTKKATSWRSTEGKVAEAPSPT